jgi:hypothetical protein
MFVATAVALMRSEGAELWLQFVLAGVPLQSAATIIIAIIIEIIAITTTTITITIIVITTTTTTTIIVIIIIYLPAIQPLAAGCYRAIIGARV